MRHAAAVAVMFALFRAIPCAAKESIWKFDTKASFHSGSYETTRREGGPEDLGGKPAIYQEDDFILNGPRIRTRAYLFKENNEVQFAVLNAAAGFFGGKESMRFEPPATLLPDGLEVGRTWSSRSSIKMLHSSDGAGDGELTLEGRVIGRERITVPAGEFDCVVLESSQKFLLHKTDGSEARTVYSYRIWFSPRAASFVKRALSFSGSGGQGTMEWRLTSYHLEGEPIFAGAGLVPKPKAPAALKADVAFQSLSGDRRLHAGGAAKVLVTVSNAGPGPAYDVKIQIRPTGDIAGLSVPAAVALGRLDPGQKAEKEVELSASRGLATAKASLRIEVKEGNGFDADPKILEFETEAFRAPKLELAAVRLGGSGVVKAGEPTEVELSIRNAGQGTAREVSAALEIESPDIFASGETRVSLSELPPGRSAPARFEFFVNKRYQGGKPLPVAVTLAESEGSYGIKNRNLGLELGGAAPAVEVVTVKGAQAPPAAPAEEEVEDVDNPPPSRTAPDPDAYAVVIGIEKYRDVPAVDFAARDAQIVQAYLTRSMGFDPKNVVLLQNERATGKDFDKYLGTWLRNRVGPKSRVLVYYAGHGAPNPKTGEGYLIPYEGDPNYTEDTAYPVKRLYASLASLPSKNVTVVLDACFSGAGGRSVIAKGARPLVALARAASAGPNTVVLSAAGGDQISASYPGGRHGLLTYFLLKGLKGAADLKGDGRITTAELFNYVAPAVEREARLQNIEQTPRLAPPPEELAGKADRVWLQRR